MNGSSRIAHDGRYTELSLKEGECGYFGQVRLRICLKGISGMTATLSIAWHEYTKEWAEAVREGTIKPPLGKIQEEKTYVVKKNDSFTVHDTDSMIISVAEIDGKEKRIRLRTQP